MNIIEDISCVVRLYPKANGILMQGFGVVESPLIIMHTSKLRASVVVVPRNFRRKARITLTLGNLVDVGAMNKKINTAASNCRVVGHEAET